MNKLLSIWNYLNGKKLLWGTVIFFIATQLKMNGLVDDPLLQQFDDYAQIVGAVLAVFGAGHKGYKLIKK